MANPKHAYPFKTSYLIYIIIGILAITFVKCVTHSENSTADVIEPLSPGTEIIDSLEKKAKKLIESKSSKAIIFTSYGRYAHYDKADSVFTFECIVEEGQIRKTSKVRFKYIGGNFEDFKNYLVLTTSLVDDFH